LIASHTSVVSSARTPSAFDRAMRMHEMTELRFSVEKVPYANASFASDGPSKVGMSSGPPANSKTLDHTRRACSPPAADRSTVRLNATSMIRASDSARSMLRLIQ
jgi:hypothetical protein